MKSINIQELWYSDFKPKIFVNSWIADDWVEIIGVRQKKGNKPITIRIKYKNLCRIFGQVKRSAEKLEQEAKERADFLREEINA